MNHRETTRQKAMLLLDKNKRVRKYYDHKVICRDQWLKFTGGVSWNYSVPDSKVYGTASWEWDGIFSEMVDSSPGGGLAEVISNQQEDGFIPHMNFEGGKDEMFWGNPRHSFVTQPPVYGLLYNTFKKNSTASSILYQAALKNIEWWKNYRLEDDLPVIVHPWETGRDAGRDNDIACLPYMVSEKFPESLKWQTFHIGKKNELAKKARFLIYEELKKNGTELKNLQRENFKLKTPDMASHLVYSIDQTIMYAQRICEHKETIHYLMNIREKIVDAACKKMWDEKDGFFYSITQKPQQQHIEKARSLGFVPELFDIDEMGRAKAKTIAGFLTLYSGIPNYEMAKRLHTHLKSPNFWTKWPVPTVAKNDIGFVADDYWRGSTWINTNYLIVIGLQRYAVAFLELGDLDSSQNFAQTALELIEKTQKLTQEYGFYEYYSSTGEGSMTNGPENFTWSTLSILLDQNADELEILLKQLLTRPLN